MNKAYFLLLLFLVPAVFAVCPTESREINMAAVVSEEAEANPSYAHDMGAPDTAGCTRGVQRSQRHIVSPAADSLLTANARSARGAAAELGQFGVPNAVESQHSPLVYADCSRRNSR